MQIKMWVKNGVASRDWLATRMFTSISGGVDGTRTRDPRRDRPVLKVNVYAGSSPIHISKKRKNEEISPMTKNSYFKVFDLKTDSR